MILTIKDTQLFKIGEINDRLQNIYRQKEKEIAAGAKNNRIDTFKKKNAKIQKFNDRIDTLKKRIKDINSGTLVMPEGKEKLIIRTSEERREETKLTSIAYYTDSPAKNFIETLFNNSINQWNKTALAKFLDDTTKKYDGLMDRKWMPALESLGMPEKLKNAKTQIIADFIKQHYLTNKNG